MSPEEAKNAFVTWAERELKLTKIVCPQRVERETEAVCFLVDSTAEQFTSSVDSAEKVLRPVTGWRDDYGLTNGIFQFKNQPYELGIGFARVDDHWLFDGSEYQKIKAQPDPGYVVVTMAGAPPRDR